MVLPSTRYRTKPDKTDQDYNDLLAEYQALLEENARLTERLCEFETGSYEYAVRYSTGELIPFSSLENARKTRNYWNTGNNGIGTTVVRRPVVEWKEYRG